MNNCQSDSTRLKRIIRGSENTFSGLYSLISDKLSRYFEVLANCCAGKCNKLRELERLLDDYNSSEDQYNDIVLDVIDNIIDKLLEDTPEVFTQYSAAFYKEVCAKVFITDPATPPDPPEPPLKNASLYLKATFYGHVCRLMEEPLPDYTYEATYGNFVCSYDDSELFPYAYEATFMGYQCVLRDGNYFYPEYSASFIDFVCEFEPACDTFSAVLCTSSELCELSMTSEWLDYSCFIAERDFDISFADHSCIKNMNYEASFQNHICVLMPRVFCASFIDFVCVLIEEVTTTTTQEVTTTTTIPVTTTTTSMVSTTTTTSEVTTTTTTSGVYPVKYGALYNWWAATDARNIANIGWRVPTVTDLNIFCTYVGNSSNPRIKDTNSTYWTAGTTNTNELLFNARGSASRNAFSGVSGGLTEVMYLWQTTDTRVVAITYSTTTLGVGGVFQSEKNGFSIRLIKESTTLSNGQSGTYVGNDGKVYRTICIGTQEWLADNLIETKYRNGDWITGYDGGVYTPISNAAWAALTTEATCYYEDDESNG